MTIIVFSRDGYFWWQSKQYFGGTQGPFQTRGSAENDARVVNAGVSLNIIQGA